MSPRKLTAADKEQILELYRLPQETTSTLAERFSVSSSTISRFLKSRLKPGEYEDLIQQKRLSRTPSGAAQVMSQFEQTQQDEEAAESQDLTTLGAETPAPSPAAIAAVVLDATPATAPEPTPEPEHHPQPRRRPRAHPSAGVGMPSQNLELPPISAYGTPTDRSEWDIDEQEAEAKAKAKSFTFPTPSPWSGVRSPFEATAAAVTDGVERVETVTESEAAAEDLPTWREARDGHPETAAESEVAAEDLATDFTQFEAEEPVVPPSFEPAVNDDDEEEEEGRDDVYALEEMLGEEVDSLDDEEEDEDEDFEDDDDFDDNEDDDDLEDDEDDDDDWENFEMPQLRDRLDDLEILPLSQAAFPRICYLVIDRSAELITHPLQEFRDLGNIPVTESQQQTLPIFDNHRVARRFSKRNQRVIKVPDGQLFEKTRPYLQAKGITRVLLDGQVYSLV